MCNVCADACYLHVYGMHSSPGVLGVVEEVQTGLDNVKQVFGHEIGWKWYVVVILLCPSWLRLFGWHRMLCIVLPFQEC